MGLVVTSTSYTVKVNFNEFSSVVGYKTSNFRRADIARVLIAHGESHIRVIMCNDESFDLSYDTHEFALVVDSVDGVIPTDNDHLTTLLEALQQV